MDDIDKAILAALQTDATLTVGELASQVGLSKSGCWRRIQALEEDGTIAARVTLLRPENVGLNQTVFTMIRTHEHTQEWFDNFCQIVTENPNIMEVHRLSGRTDYLLRSVVSTMEHYDGMYKSLISHLNFFDIDSSFSMETIKSTTVLPLNDA